MAAEALKKIYFGVTNRAKSVGRLHSALGVGALSVEPAADQADVRLVEVLEGKPRLPSRY